MGQKIGLLGKEGGSGGWTHLHFGISARQPSGRFGTQEGYAFLWQAYRERHQPKVVAVARPHHLIWSGETVELDGSKSHGTWGFGDGSLPVTVRSDGSVRPHDPLGYAETDHRYEEPGTYLVKVQRTDGHGQTATARLVVRVE
jgi:hypothetical protein